MSTVEDLLSDGILGRVESIAAMRGEEVCIIIDPEPFDAAAAATDYELDEDEEKEEEEGEEEVPSGGDKADREDDTGCESDEDEVCDGDSNEDMESDSASEVSKILEGVTYTELQWAYQAVAAQLQFRYGVKGGDKVIVCGKGNVAAEMVALLACMHVQAPFVPIDAAWFVGTRMQDIVKDAQPVAAIVVAEDDTDRIVTSLAAAGLYRCVYLTPSGQLVQSFDTADASLQDAEESHDGDQVDYNRFPLYILYTSGSTGRPKGVIGTHRGLVNRMVWQMKHFPFAPCEVVCRRTPLVFVDAMAEIFSALVCMVPLWSPPADRLRAEGIGGIATEANQAGVSRITLLPSQLHQACTLYPQMGSVWQSLKVVFVSGEECSVGVVKLVQQCLPAVTLVNLYGSTEVAGDVSYYVACNGSDKNSFLEHGHDSVCLSGAKRVPIGLPIEGNYLFVTEHADPSAELSLPESRLRVLPDGEVGELMVVGEHLALGYHNNAASMTSRFVPNPLRDHDSVSAEARSYAMAFFTGDLAYRDASTGLFYWCGRVDRQVKIRGVRIELEDVERQVCVALGADQGIVVLALDLQKEIESNTQSAKTLVLFLEQSVLRDEKEEHSTRTVEQVKAELTQKLPASLVPGLVLEIDAFSRNTTGKIDRNALQANVEAMFATSEQAASEPAKQPPTAIAELSESAIATAVVDTFNSVLRIANTVCIDPLKTNFFALGGDSVRMIEVLWALRQWTGLSVTPADLHLSVKDLAQKMYQELHEIGVEADENPSKRQKSSTPAAAASEFGTSEYPRPIAGAAPSLSECAPRYWKGRCNSGSYNHNLHEEESNVDDGGQTAEGRLCVKWSVPLVKCVDASPLVVVASSSFSTASPSADESSERSQRTIKIPTLPSHLVIIGSHGGDVVAVDGATGGVVWTIQLGEHIEASAVSDATASRIFLGTFSGQDVDGFKSRRPVGNAATSEAELGCFWCLDALTGDVMWHVCTTGEIKGAALVVDECVFVGAYDGHLYQFHTSDGALIGKYPCSGSIYAAPVLSSDGTCIFVATTAGTLTQFAYSGKNASLMVLGNMQSAPIFATPAATSTGGLLTAGTDGSVTHWVSSNEDSRVLSPKWREALSTKPIFSSPCVVSPSVGRANSTDSLGLVGCHDGCLRLIQIENSLLQWESKLNRVAVFSSPCVFQKDLCVTATVAGEVQVMSMTTGKLVASLQLPGEIFSSAVCLRDCVYIGCRDDRLYCLQFISI